jgi:hypothetical protein
MKNAQKTKCIHGIIMAGLVTGFMGSVAAAQITRIEITSRSAIPSKSPDAIPYEIIKGQLFGEVDPRDPHNAPVQDLELAPRNERGHAEYTVTFTLTRPSDHTRSSHVLIYSVVNRGADIYPQDHRSGDTFLTSGWQGDRPFGGKSIMGTVGESIRVPVAQGADGKPVTGRVLARFPDVAPGTSSLPLAAALGYASSGTPPTPASLDSSQGILTFRTYEDPLGVQAKADTINSSDWTWGDCTHDSFPGKTSDSFICIKGGFRSDGLYQLEYTAKDPLILGIGLTAIRDAVSFFRYETKAAEGINPIAGEIRHTIAVGASQSGNAIRTFVNLGMNQDVRGRIVWDGVMPIIAARQTPVNLRFAIPGGASGLYEPGSDGVLWWTDWPDKKRSNPTSGLLHRCNATKTCPKIVEVFGSSEFYSLRASGDFVGTSADADIPLPSNVRRYYVAGTQHGGGAGGFNWLPPPPPQQMSILSLPCVLPSNPNPQQEINRALLVALKEWVVKNVEPPPSLYPTLRAGDLASEAHVLASFPWLPGTPSPLGVMNPTVVYDYGPRFRANDVSGIMDMQPPIVKGIIPSVLPTLDADGNEIGGVLTVLRQAPLGTYLGWNVVSSGFFKGHFCSLTGGYVPFALTRLDREKQNDPRPSLEERYVDHAGYVAKVRSAANDLVKKRLLLQDDADRIIREAEASSVLLP